MSGFIIPADQEGSIEISKEARQAALQAAAGIESSKGGPYVYLAQHDSTAVTERNEGKGGDWIVGNVGDRVVNLGSNPAVVVVGHQVRYVQTRYDAEKKRRVVVFNLPWEQMSTDQQSLTDLDWKDDRAAKPVDSFMLVHVSDKGFDPHGIKAFNYQPKPGSAKDGGTWAKNLKATAHRNPPVAPFAAIWQLGSVMADTGHGTKKLSATHKYLGSVHPGKPEWEELRKSWFAFEEMKGMGDSGAFGGVSSGSSDDDDDAARMADEYDQQDNYVEPLPPEAYDDYGTPAEPDVPSAAAKAGMDWDTPVMCGKDDAGIMHRKPVPEMSFNEAKVATSLALPHSEKNENAAGALALIEAWARHQGWDTESLGFAPF